MELRSTIRELRKDIKSLAGALHAISQPGADVPAVLQGLPPMLVQDALRLGVAGSAPTGDQRGAGGAGEGAGRRGAGGGGVRRSRTTTSGGGDRHGGRVSGVGLRTR